MRKILLLGILVFANIILSFGQNIESILERSQQLFYEGKYSEAVELLESTKHHFKKNTPEYASIIFFLGTNYLLMDNLPNAESCYLEATKIFKKGLGKEHPKYAAMLNHLGEFYYNIENYVRAEKYFLEGKKIIEKVLGKDHSEYACSLNGLGNLYSDKREYTKAEQYLLEAKDIFSENEEYQYYATSSYNLGRLYNILGDYVKAEEHFLESLAIREIVLEAEHPDYESSLYGISLLYITTREYSKAEKYFLDLLSIQEKKFGKEDPDYAVYLKYIGFLYYNMSKYQTAEKCFLEAKSIFEKVLGRENRDHATSLNHLGYLYIAMGDYDKAEKCFLEAKKIIEKVFGKKDLDYESSLYGLGTLYLKMDEYAKAEQYLLEANEILGNKEHHKNATSLTMHPLLTLINNTVEHNNYATSLSSLGGLYDKLGDYVNAEKYYLKSLSVCEKVFGKEDPVYATFLHNLGNLYTAMGDYAKAKQYILEALSIGEKKMGKENESYATFLSNLGSLHRAMDDINKVEQYFLEAKSIRERVLGKRHPDYAVSLGKLGQLYCSIDDFDKAKHYYLEALTIHEDVLGKEHSDYALSLENLGILYIILGELDKFETIIAEVHKIKTTQVKKNFTFLSNRQRNLFWEKEKISFEVSYSFAYSHPTSSITPLVYDNTLFTKGLMLRTANEIRDVIYTSGNADLITNFEQLGNIRQQITALQTKATPDLNFISTLESRADSLDKALTIASSEYREFKEDLTVGWNDIQKHLKPNEVAIEFVNFKLFNKQITSTDSVMYCAMLIRKDSDMPEFIPLFEQSQLVESLQSKGVTFVERIENLYKGGSHFFNGQKLYNLIWEPLEKHLEGIETVYYSPAGLLNKISFAAIPVDSLCLIDKYNLQLLSSTREIVHKSKKQEEFLPLHHAVIYGGIKYDIQDATQLIASAEKYKTSEIDFLSSRSLPNDDTRSASWKYLQGTEIEVNEIEKLLQRSNIHITKYMDAEANEESFKNLSGKSPELLHIATHGFFLENEKKIRENPFMQMISENTGSRTVHNPLLRAGLLFAGGNRAWTNTEVIADIEDGILLADEIANLNLTNTKLAVLSACETALGDVDNSEGVFGLQRSFKLAGVETLIMSLWKVNDEVTCKFMLTFYQNLLDGKTKLASFNTAQKQIREKYKNPYYWAAFIMLD